MNLPFEIKRLAATSYFAYAADGSRARQWGADGTRIYLPGFEDVMHGPTGQETETRAYLGNYAVLSRRPNYTVAVEYLLRDRLGSVDAVGEANGNIAHPRGYDAFGKPRGHDWADLTPPRQGSEARRVTQKGFTQHEHLDSVELIHMNGRAFDYNLGRFLSVDPFIQFPLNSQSLNPYSYILNNPMSGTDPTGYVSCDEVSANQAGSGTCDFLQGGKSIEVGYSINSQGDIALGHGVSSAELSASVSIGVLNHTNGAQGLSPMGVPAGEGRGAGVESSNIGSMAKTVGKATASILAPNASDYMERGRSGTWGQYATGLGKATANFGVSALAAGYSALNPLAQFGISSPRPPATFPIQDEELGGAATFDFLLAAPILRAGQLSLRGSQSGRVLASQSSLAYVEDLTSIPRAGLGENVVVLGQYWHTGRDGVTRNLFGALDSFARDVGGRTLVDLPGVMGSLGPAIQSADRIIFFTSSRMGPLTASEMQLIQSNAKLLEKTTFVPGFYP